MSEGKPTGGSTVANALLPGGGAFDRSRLKGLRNDIGDAQAAAGAKELAGAYRIEQVAAPVAPPEAIPIPAPAPPRRALARPRSPIAPHVEMPYEGDEVIWDAHLRCDFPAYVLEQVGELAHRDRRTLVSALLKILAAHVDDHGKPLFYIRPEDMVPDRRKAVKRKR